VPADFAGHEVRYVSVEERDGKVQVVLPYYRTRRIAVMTLRRKTPRSRRGVFHLRSAARPMVHD
jgi:hypothetical protein